MKKYIISVILCLLLLCITGCSAQDGNEEEISNYVWRMTTIQSYEQNGDIIACGTGEPQYAELPRCMM